MSEFMFTIKCFLASVVLILAFQVKISERTIENHIVVYARNSPISDWVHSAAAGGVRLIHEGQKLIQKQTKNLFGNEEQESMRAYR